MNPFSKYIDCINCGNELIDVSSLSFQTPEMVTCDYCGQQYPGLSRKIKTIKRTITILFVIIALFVSTMAWKTSGALPAFLSILPMVVLYYFALGVAVRKSIRF